ncbi:unnamed protein product [Ceutorhynchus assimilis]|uniref:Uncharacterized protein n=1 Tax=Ceutorhynchus assimilis TaxID=467358 RepID=A0A9N9MJ82_9CUCU|nr:unnamed protein product [Ceutorhynchus assimilis]
MLQKNPNSKPQQVEIIVEELQLETLKEFERIKADSLNQAAEIKTKHIDNIKEVSVNLKTSIGMLLLQNNPHENYLKGTEKLYKEAIKQIHNIQESMWLELNVCTAETKNEIKNYYESAKEIVDEDDTRLDKVYKNCKRFLEKQMKKTYFEVKQIGIRMQEEIITVCRKVKKNQMLIKKHENYF